MIPIIIIGPIRLEFIGVFGAMAPKTRRKPNRDRYVIFSINSLVMLARHFDIDIRAYIVATLSR